MSCELHQMCGTTCKGVEQLEAQIAELEKKLDWYRSGDIHTCHAECQRVECCQRRVIAELRDEVEKLRIFNRTLDETRAGAKQTIESQRAQIAELKQDLMQFQSDAQVMFDGEKHKLNAQIAELRELVREAFHWVAYARERSNLVPSKDACDDWLARAEGALSK